MNDLSASDRDGASARGGTGGPLGGAGLASDDDARFFRGAAQEPFPAIAVPRALLDRWPHLPAFWPGRRVVAAERAGAGAVLLLPEDDEAPRGWPGEVLRFTLAPFAPARFAGRDAPPLIVLALGEAGGKSPGMFGAKRARRSGIRTGWGR
ncbi:hypothetical protein ACE7GA_11390 [Roseomonas sp. CCTCC AB2023176]|uniref:hypothetical protein n=1 Tax=Roseomonas sp. CCTCC AB2023176 TaxID=3342640 RepID=UPI0035E0877D